MKSIARLFITSLLVGWLLACGATPVPTEPVPAATARPTPLPTATARPLGKPTETSRLLGKPTATARLPGKPTETSRLPGQPTATAGPGEAGSPGETVEAGEAWSVTSSFDVGLAAVAAADFDGDGHLDLVSGGEPALTIYRGDGAGGFSPVSHVPGGQEPDDFAVADLDEDGDLDIAVANHDTDYLTLLLGDGAGAFVPAPNSPLRVEVGPHPHAVRAADLDGDGQVDLVVDDRDAEGLLILRGLGGGRFESPGTLVAVGGDPYRGMALGDINGDGKLDLVTPNPGEAGVLINASHEGIAFVPGSPVPAEAPFAVALGDFNGDGRLDLIAASDEGSARVEVFLGDGQGGFEAAAGSPYRLAPGGKNIAVGDFDGDGLADAAVASYQHPEVLVLWGGRDTMRTGTLAGGEHPWGLAAADFNRDGRDDLVIVDDGALRATVYLSLGP